MAPDLDNIPSPSLSPKLAEVTLAEMEGAISLQQQGLLKEAKAICDGILASDPMHVGALHLLGILEYQMGSRDFAAGLVAKAIAIVPNDAAYYSNLGNVLQELGRFDDAVLSFDRAIRIKCNFAEAHYNSGNALTELKKLGAAVASYDRAIAIKSDYAEAYSNRGLMQQDLGNFAVAIGDYYRATAIKPAFADTYSNRGNALKELKQLDAAVVSYERAIAIKSDYTVTYSNRGLALQELKQLEAAVGSYDCAVILKPDLAEPYSNRGIALHALNRLGAAASHDRAVVVKPDLAEACWNKSIVLLLDGELGSGWKLHEWRWKGAETSRNHRRHFAQPLWLGAEPIRGKTILLHAEQGLGDTIQFCRYAKLVAALGARVILEVPAPLVDLLNGLEGISRLMVTGTPLPTFDCHCPLLSLPLAFKTDLTSIPAGHAYLSSDPDKVAIWAARLGAKIRPRVGMVWSGSATHRNDQNRSIALSLLLQYLPDAFEYVSMQKEVRDIDKGALERHGNIKHFGYELNDFADTAALCELMDVVISVDTSVAHLSGALGKRTWVLLPYVPDWRWLLDRDDSPWYPSIRLYRQDADVDWMPVLERVKAELTALPVEST